MRAKELITLTRKLIKAGHPLMIKGAPGVGKSDIVAQACEAEGYEMILMHPVVSDPTDFKGMPAVVDGLAEFLPFGDLRQLVIAKKPTVCFLDDLGQAPAVVQAAAMQLILARRVNGHRVSDKVVFVAATNRREDRAGVTGILEPVKSRFATIVQLDPHVDDWSEWAQTAGIAPEVIAFARFRPNLLVNPGDATSDIVNRPSPRTFVHLSKVYQAGIEDLEVLAGSVGNGAATEFLGFLRVCKELPDIDAILANPEKEAVPTNPASLYAVVSGLVVKATDKNVMHAITYMDRLPDEFSVLGVRDLKRKIPDCNKSKQFVKWAMAHQKVLV